MIICEDPKKCCINCHFLILSSNPPDGVDVERSYRIPTWDQRKALLECEQDPESIGGSRETIGCYQKVWDAGMSAGHTCPPMKYFAKEGEETITRTEFDERIAARRRCKLTKDRNLPDQHSECFYYEFTPGVALNAAKKVEKRKDIYRRNQRDRERFADDAAKDRAINRKIFWALLASPTASFLVNLPILLFGTDIG